VVERKFQQLREVPRRESQQAAGLGFGKGIDDFLQRSLHLQLAERNLDADFPQARVTDENFIFQKIGSSRWRADSSVASSPAPRAARGYRAEASFHVRPEVFKRVIPAVTVRNLAFESAEQRHPPGRMEDSMPTAAFF
jgi:hypothetical protein